MTPTKQLAPKWEEEYQKIMHDWFKRVVTLELDEGLIGRIKGTSGGFWAIRNYKLEEFIANLLSSQKSAIVERIKGMKKKYDLSPLDEWEEYYNQAISDAIRQVKEENEKREED